MKKLLFALTIILLLPTCKKSEPSQPPSPPPPDQQVTIGTQVWMLKNLDVSAYRNGDPIPKITDAKAWFELTTGAWCWYNNDEAKYGATYGKLYNWYAVNDSRGLAPKGWHVPTDGEWTILETFLGGLTEAGGKMKETGTTHWETPNTGATNSSGFTALPGDLRYGAGDFGYVGFFGRFGGWWSSSLDGTNNAFYRFLRYDDPNLGRASYHMKNGFSVRCIKD